MILGFKNQFPPLILKGTKIHTIREDKPNRWKEGNKIHFATGVRTKNYNQFGEAVCTGTQKIVIKYRKTMDMPDIYIDGIDVWKTGITTLARNDGFENFMDFIKWFNKDFEGKIIHWTDLRY